MCDIACVHKLDWGGCRICRMKCEHSWGADRCLVCSVVCGHRDGYGDDTIVDGKCLECGSICCSHMNT